MIGVEGKGWVSQYGVWCMVYGLFVDLFVCLLALRSCTCM